MTLTAVTVQDVDGGQINTSPSTWYLAIDVVNGFFSLYLFIRITRSNLISAC